MKLFFALLLFPFFAHASTWAKDTGWELKPSSDGIWQVLPDQPSANKPTGVTCTSGNCTATRPTPLPKVNPPSTFNPSSGFTKVGIALGLVSRLGPWISVGMAAYNWLQSAHIRVEPDNSLSQEFGGTTLSSGTWSGISADSPTARYSSSASACLAGVAAINSSNSPYYRSFSASLQSVSSSSSPATCAYSYTAVTTTGSNTSGSVTGTVTQVSPTDQWCFNSSGVAVVRPTGGLCPAGVYSPVTVQNAANSLSSTSITDPNLAKVWREVLDNGGKIDDTGPAQLTGPTQLPGPTSTSVKTTATGTQAVTTTTTNYNITYNTNNITINESKVISNPDGSSETVTQKSPEPCAVDPTSLTCAKLGDPGTDSPQWQTKIVTYQAESLGLGAACPAPWAGTVHGWNLSMSWQPACDVAPNVRLGILALATLGALLMIVTTVRT